MFFFSFGVTCRFDSVLELLSNNKPVALVDHKLQVNWQPDKPGVVVFEVVVKDSSGGEIYRSSKMDIIVQKDN